MAHSGVTVDDKCVELFNELKMFKVGKEMKYRYISMKLTDDMSTIVIDKSAPRNSSFDDMVTDLPAQDCRWVVFDFEWTMTDSGSGNSVGKNKLGLIQWAPENAKIRSKMVFASSTDAVRKKLNFNAPGKHCNDTSDLVFAEMLEFVKGH